MHSAWMEPHKVQKSHNHDFMDEIPEALGTLQMSMLKNKKKPTSYLEQTVTNTVIPPTETSLSYRCTTFVDRKSLLFV